MPGEEYEYVPDPMGRLSFGDRRDDVAKLEGLLAFVADEAALQRSGPTGAFDDAVEAALKRYQRRQGLAVDGRVAPRRSDHGCAGGRRCAPDRRACRIPAGTSSALAAASHRA